ncbi:MAG: DinB family protein [Pseudomonadota bacterium]
MSTDPNTPQPVPALCQDNIDCLQRLTRLLERLDTDQFTGPVTPCDSGIGAHVRHILDHYDAFLAGVATGLIDYDARGRCQDTECSPDFARQRIQRTCDQLAHLSVLPDAVTVKMDCGSSLSRTLTTPSSGLRELQFLVSHTVHHDALIAAAAKALEVPPESDYGVAPSTIRHLKRQQG